MGQEAGAAGAAAVFDGMLKGWPEEWPEKASINILNIPKERKDFILTLACDIYKNTKIDDPRKQANEAIDHAVALYNALKSKGYL